MAEDWEEKQGETGKKFFQSSKGPNIKKTSYLKEIKQHHIIHHKK